MATDSEGFSQALGGVQTSIPQSTQVVVNKDNILQAAKIIQDVLDEYSPLIAREFRALKVVAPGNDPISVQAAQQWNQKLRTDPDSYENRVLQYLQSLGNLVTNLKTSATRYGYTEDQIAAAFNGTPRA
jgi:hypothetical protein